MEDETQLGPTWMRKAELFVQRAGIVIEPVTLQYGELARPAFPDFGTGRHKAALNLGECFSYALAKTTGEPLLFMASKVSQTDIQAAE
jgi:ribonuclease VapC